MATWRPHHGSFYVGADIFRFQNKYIEVVKSMFATAPPSTVTRQVGVNVTQYTTSYVPVTVTSPAVTLVTLLLPL